MDLGEVNSIKNELSSLPYSFILNDLKDRFLFNDSEFPEICRAIEKDHNFVFTLNGEGEGKARLTLTSLTLPQTVYEVDLATSEREVVEEPEVEFATDDYEVKQVWYSTPDGVEAPMYVVHRNDIELTGDHPTMLNGYGGFTSSITPRFSTTAAVWLEEGGVYAVATLRGGNEFGESWHRAGMLENKQNVFDGFIAAAEWLIENGYTNPGRRFFLHDMEYYF